MSDNRKDSGPAPSEDGSAPPEAVAGGAQWHPLATAAIIGGAVAATAGAYLGTRALARRNGKVNAVMATAITACDLAQRQHDREPNAADIDIERPARR